MDGRRRGDARRQYDLSQLTIDAARDLRKRETSAEQVLWAHLRHRRLNGLKFRRQHPFEPFVLDFCCMERHLVVELDGAIHDQQVEQDEWRTQYICSFGYRMLRFRNEEVMDNLPNVLSRIVTASEMPLTTLSELDPALAHELTPPLPCTGEGVGG